MLVSPVVTNRVVTGLPRGPQRADASQPRSGLRHAPEQWRRKPWQGRHHPVAAFRSSLSITGIDPGWGHQWQVLTAERSLLGTVGYMSPEQANCRPLDGRSDTFSLGVLIQNSASWNLLSSWFHQVGGVRRSGNAHSGISLNPRGPDHQHRLPI